MTENPAFEALAPGLSRLRAPNPSPMTHTGTNTYLLGHRDIGVIDPGPDLDDHLGAILAAIPVGARITHILVTHAHRDHAPLARRLNAATDAPVLAAGDLAGRRRPVMARLAEAGGLGGGEGVDAAFAPDGVLEDGDCIESADWRLGVIATPGHTADHLSFTWQGAVFSGDHVMGWASSLISPPDGDLTSFLASCATLAGRPDRVYYPGHGAPIDAPQERVAWLVAHRQARERQILDALGLGPATARTLAARIYADTPPALLGAAERNVLAHLIALWESGRVTTAPPLAAASTFALT